ncbi:uncharacterized protein LOC111335766 [Stylophora pistillata]|nr:uncharacterized protein LOC111335766 [Stylophora pistillata]
MAAVVYLGRRFKSCLLQSHLWKSFGLYETRHQCNSSVCRLSFYSGRRWNTQRKLSTAKVGIPAFKSNTSTRKFDHPDRDRRIMVVLQKKRGEKVLQLHEEDLLNYFSVYGEITSVSWVRTKETDQDTGKGFGFVSFSSVPSFQKAVASKYHTIEGRPVLVFPATKRADSQPSRVAPQTAVVTDQRASASDEIASETALKIDGKRSKGAPVKTYSKPMASPDWTESGSMKAVPESAATLDQGTSGEAPLMTATEPGVIPRETTYSAMNIAQQATQEQKTSVQEEALSAAPQHVEVAGGAKNAQKASMHLESGKVRFTGKASPVSPEDQKRKILVTQRKGCKGEMTLKSVHDYFSVFGKIEQVQENSDLIYVTFESANSAEQVMTITNHRIDNVMVLVSLAYSNKQRKQLRIEKALDDVKRIQDPRKIKIAEREGRKIVIMTPTRFKESISTEMLENYFSSYGEIEEILVIKSKGYGFVIFKEAGDAEKILKIQNHIIGNVEVFVKLSLASRHLTQNEPKRIVVSNISGETSEREIRKHFGQFGKVVEVVFANPSDDGERPDSCIVVFDSIDSGIESVIGESHQIYTQQVALAVKLPEDKVMHARDLPNLFVSNVPESMTLEMIRSYFEEFGLIQHLGFTSYKSEEVISNLHGISVAFCDESVLEKTLQKNFHEINRFYVRVTRAPLMFTPSDFLSLRILMTSLPSGISKHVVEDYLLQNSCRVETMKFISPTVCLADLWNLRDVDRLVEQASKQQHVICGSPISLRRYYWNKKQEDRF